ncbi:MAG: ABC transporter ATP-binding protein [Porphyromonas sp.]
MIDLVRFILRGHKWGIILIILFGLGTVATNLVFIWLSKCVIDIAAHQRAGSIHTFSAALVITLGLQVLFRVISVRLTNYTGAKMSNAVQSKVFAHLLYTRWSNLGQMHSGDMVVRMLKDTDGLVTFFVSSLPTAILAAAQLLGALCLLYYFNPTLALILGVGMPLLAIFSKVYYKRMRHYTDEMKQAESEITAQIQETLLNQTVIRTFERQATSIDHLLMRQGKYLRAVKRQTFVSVFANLLMQGAFSSGYIVAFLWSARGLYGGTITFGLMTSFLQLVARIQSPLTTLIGILPSLISSKSSLDRLVNLLEFKTEQMGRGVQLTGPVRLEVKDMSFRYAEDEDWVYQHFSLEASSGEMIALMGRTGAGKTTLLRLLLGLVPPTEGTISLTSATGTYPVNEITRGNFVYVPQGGSLFSGTIRDNLLIGDEEATDADLKRVLHLAVADFVFDLPKGLDTVIGERGLGLSEGQAQRIAIARALLRPGKILLLDEATSALDQDTEAQFLGYLRAHASDRLVIFITHHPDVAAQCDRTLHL